MESRQLGRTGRQVGVIGLGCWQLGADWGAVSEQDALATLHAAVDAGVSFLDTADVYGDGRSEQLVGRLLRERGDAGRRWPPRWDGAPTRTCPRPSPVRPCAPGTTAAAATSASTPSTWCSCTARQRPSTQARRCSTRWTRWSTRAG